MNIRLYGTDQDQDLVLFTRGLIFQRFSRPRCSLPRLPVMVVMSHFALGQLIVMALERADTALKHQYFPPELEHKALKLSPAQGSHGSGSC